MTPLEKYKRRRERDHPWSKRERSPTMGEASGYSESGFGVDPDPVGAVSNRTGLKCLINSKIYYK